LDVSITTVMGTVDTWSGALDALNDEDGSIVVIYPPHPKDESRERNVKELTVRSQVDQGPDLPPLDVSKKARVAAVYAPGAWHKVEYNA
jgi:hypothetical protein